MADLIETPHCPLLTIPRELRDLIYEYTFGSTDVRIQPHSDLVYTKLERRNASLLLTCKQIHFEATKLYYQHTPFFSTEESDLTDWLIKLLDRHRNAVRNVKLIFAFIHPKRYDQDKVETYKTRIIDGIHEDLVVAGCTLPMGLTIEVEAIPTDDWEKHERSAWLIGPSRIRSWRDMLPEPREWREVWSDEID